MAYLYLSDECQAGTHGCPGKRDTPTDPDVCGGGICTCDCHVPAWVTDLRRGGPYEPPSPFGGPVTGHQGFGALHDGLNLHPCGGCGRKTTAAYCCGPCADASERHYEIHEDGPLGHTASCNDRHARRSAT